MALLLKSLCSFGRNNNLLKDPHCLLKLTGRSYQHSVKTTSGTPNIHILSRMVEPNNINHLPVLSMWGKLTSPTRNIPLILPTSNGKSAIIDLPACPLVSSLEMPTCDAFLDNAHIMPVKIKIEEPDDKTKVQKWAIRMIIIRRHKMKKHRRKKFLKRTRIVYSRIKKARKALKEKNLQLKLLAQMNEGRNFSARQYAYDLLCAAYEKIELPPKHRIKKPWEL